MACTCQGTCEAEACEVSSMIATLRTHRLVGTTTRSACSHNTCHVHTSRYLRHSELALLLIKSNHPLQSRLYKLVSVF